MADVNTKGVAIAVWVVVAIYALLFEWVYTDAMYHPARELRIHQHHPTVVTDAP